MGDIQNCTTNKEKHIGSIDGIYYNKESFRNAIIRLVSNAFKIPVKELLEGYYFEDDIASNVDKELLGKGTSYEWEVSFEGLPVGDSSMLLSISYSYDNACIVIESSFISSQDNIDEMEMTLSKYNETRDGKEFQVADVGEGSFTMSSSIQANECYGELVEKAVRCVLKIITKGKNFASIIRPILLPS